MTPLHDPFTKRSSVFHAYPVRTGSSDEADLVTTLATFKHAWPGLTTGRAFKPFGPPDTLQIAGVGRLIREKMLKLQQSPG